MPSLIHKVESVWEGTTACGADGNKVTRKWEVVTCKKCLEKKPK